MSEEIFLTFADQTSDIPNDLYFQFDDDKPFLIQADVTGDYSITLSPTGREVSIEFHQNEKRFRIFFKPKA